MIQNQKPSLLSPASVSQASPNYESSLLPYVCWYQNDFLGGVRGMRAHEIGIYTILLNEIYARGRPLDLSKERLARLCGCDKRTFVSALDMLIAEGKILNLASGLWNQRCENVFQEREKLLEQKSFAGRSSAQKRKKINAQVQHLPDEYPRSDERNSEAQKREEKETPNGVLQKNTLPGLKKGTFFGERVENIPSQGTTTEEDPKGRTSSCTETGEQTVTSLKGERLPSNWTADLHAAISEGLSEEQARWQEKKFRDYWRAKSGKEALKMDWQATWRNWFRREIERLKENRERLAALSSRPDTSSRASSEEDLYCSLINYQVNEKDPAMKATHPGLINDPSMKGNSTRASSMI
ncbi:phage related protein [Bartonella australis AUST/NH1]|uniref:Phage related protein n=1 Tax=Bartonella australis (strain Aust/NH1) TaxID=1094489 RepID=M1N542_BARAA|nr:DUF1376 domain-containing protein [Bartonella australis]AGF74979.1 phage related protein [Bartonella australis AUST/NH1]